FLTAYALAAASDWLQGAYLYALYRDEHHVKPAVIPLLFATGFVASAVSGAFIGSWADRYGRKRACMGFCAVYALSCFFTTTTTSIAPWFGGVGLAGLVLGRVLGGVGTGLLFCAFDSWFVGDLRVQGLGDGEEEEMGRVFGMMSSLNSLVAIVCGVASEAIVGLTGTRKAPFWAAIGVLGLAAVVIAASWEENYGQKGGEQAGKKKDNTAKNKLWTILSNPRVLALGAASTVFEGSMYLFVFFWTPALKSVHSSQGELPYGIIFSSFMAATLASSLAFNMITEWRLIDHSSLLVAIMGTSAVCFLLSSSPLSEQSAFWVFCFFEAAVGMYWPCMGFLKGKLIEDGVRAQVYAMLRIPLNIFVVVSLLFTGGGDTYGRVFLVCSTLLLASTGTLWAL
ncbi:DUF791-domain-containing protein, partial [Canariomyces notabilis]